MNETIRGFWRHICSAFLQGHKSHRTLTALISEDEKAVGYNRIDARAHAKEWLIAHGPTLAANDVLLAQEHFGYLLPPGWESR